MRQNDAAPLVDSLSQACDLAVGISRALLAIRCSALAPNQTPPPVRDYGFRRLAVAAAAVGLWMGVGFAFHLGANPYLLVGVPLTVAFQVLIARRPIPSLWLLDGRPFHLDRRGVVVAAFVAILPLYATVSAIVGGHVINVAYGLAAVAGAPPAAFALVAMNDVARRALVRSILTAGLFGGGLFLLNAIVTRGAALTTNPAGAVQAFGVSFLLYVPVGFVLEEVFFRGALDTYVRGPSLQNDRTSAVFVSILWGLWHVPVVIPTIGLSQIPALLAFQLIAGVLLTFPWRSCGNLAVPGVTHALVDAIRNGLAAA